jgi:hypothetical protein
MNLKKASEAKSIREKTEVIARQMFGEDNVDVSKEERVWIRRAENPVWLTFEPYKTESHSLDVFGFFKVDLSWVKDDIIRGQASGRSPIKSSVLVHGSDVIQVISDVAFELSILEQWSEFERQFFS